MRAVRRPSSRPLEGGEGKWVVCSVNARTEHHPTARLKKMEKRKGANPMKKVFVAAAINTRLFVMREHWPCDDWQGHI